MTNVLLDKKGNIAVATINRPKALNALNSAVVADLDEMIGQIMADEEIRALVITGSGEKAFVAGADIGEMSTLTRPKARPSASSATTFSAGSRSCRSPRSPRSTASRWAAAVS